MSIINFRHTSQTHILYATLHPFAPTGMGNKKNRLGVSRVVRGTFVTHTASGEMRVTKRKHTTGQVERDQAEMKQRRAARLNGKYLT